MKENKIKKIKYDSQDTKEIKTLILITAIVSVIAIGLYFLTNKILVVREKPEEVAEVEFDYDVCTVGMIFNRPYKEYYVFIYDSTENNANQYNSLLTNYRSKDNAVKSYYVDLNIGFNKSAISESANKKPTNSSEVKVNKSALILIKNGKVSKYYEDITNYEKVLN